ncbi:hypothetical protein Lsai_2856 [Legionella sainthelensi]|uniref:Uncharacterized protein n=1 Tax=Legionella sainthelensi TaxID=28087 RepID=A0A0W0YEI9_9GAMM|nr:hypothetical protein [Legionella sainthelensi]KTD55264.1 hypothetical protein Lsai_2856 [Legionella sainthelensi]VEH37306.1 Uncharacterised protein [Legionella sainthelensi]
MLLKYDRENNPESVVELIKAANTDNLVLEQKVIQADRIAIFANKPVNDAPFQVAPF